MTKGPGPSKLNVTTNTETGEDEVIRTKLAVGCILLVAGLCATAAPASAEFIQTNGSNGKCVASAEVKCGETTEEIVLEVSGTSFTCPAGGALVESWTIEKKEPQEEIKQGPHETIVFSCPEGKSKVSSTAKAKLEPGCAVQIEQKPEQKTEVKGKVTGTCKIVVGASLCVATVESAGNKELLKTTVTKPEAKRTLLNFLVTGITVKGKGICGFTESNVGELRGMLTLLGQELAN